MAQARCNICKRIRSTTDMIGLKDVSSPFKFYCMDCASLALITKGYEVYKIQLLLMDDDDKIAYVAFFNQCLQLLASKF